MIAFTVMVVPEVLLLESTSTNSFYLAETNLDLFAQTLQISLSAMNL